MMACSGEVGKCRANRWILQEARVGTRQHWFDRARQITEKIHLHLEQKICQGGVRLRRMAILDRIDQALVQCLLGDRIVGARR